MPMTQQDIRAHHRHAWKVQAEHATGTEDLRYSDPVQDAVLYPAYEGLIADHGIRADGGRILDVGSGSGRFVRFFLERYRPVSLVGIDFSESSVELLGTWHKGSETDMRFRVTDITDPDLDLEGGFDLVNVANVLFHIPEPDLFAAALRNLCRLVAPGGCIVTTEYLPRRSMRTEWMLVRSRYEFEAAAADAGLRVCDVRASSFFSADPMGLDGPDDGPRRNLHKVRANVGALLRSMLEEGSRAFLIDLFAEIDRASLAFARERIADVDCPGQKLVVLRRA